MTGKSEEILSRAEAIFGSREAAEAWMNRPAIGLDRRKPADMISSTEGVEAVLDYLTRIEHGVHT